MWERPQKHKRGPKGAVGTCFGPVFEEGKIPRFLDKPYFNAEKREENGLVECIVGMWEMTRDVGVPQQSCQDEKTSSKFTFLAAKPNK
jgi:hypothetical protein